MGLDPYTSEHELWELKTGRKTGFNGNAKTRWGHRMERLGLDVWADAHPNGQPVANDRPYTSPAYPHLWATPDALGDGTGRGEVGIEVKVTAAWQEPPERVRIQCLVQAALADLVRVDVVRLSFEDDPAIFRIERDEDTIADILAAGEAWYVRHVLGDIEPPLGAGEAPADERQTVLAADMRRVKKAQEVLSRQERAIRDDLIASVAGQGVITGNGFRIEVRRSRGAMRTGWKEVSTAYRKALEPHMDTDALDTIVGLYQTTGTPTTSVYPQWDEEEQG